MQKSIPISRDSTTEKSSRADRWVSITAKSFKAPSGSGLGGSEFLSEKGDAELFEHPPERLAIRRGDALFPAGEWRELIGFVGIFRRADGGAFGTDLHGFQVANDVRHLCVRRGRGEVAADETIEVALQAGITFWRGEYFLAEGEQLLDPFAELVGEAGQIAARLFGHADEASFSEREGRRESERVFGEMLKGGFLE